MSDGTIRRLLAEGRLVIDPIEPGQVQPASVDVRLGSEFLVFRNHTAEVIDPYEKRDDLMEKVRVPEGQPFVLHPGEFVLGTTLEAIGLPDDLVARVEGKSSLGRLGLLIHATAGFVDPGWTRGQITLELSNVATLPIKLWPGMRIGQLSFHCLDAPAERPYGHPDLGSKYVGQRGPVASQYQQNRHAAEPDQEPTAIDAPP
nr:dCTP deaminase [Motilibacter deserti]